MFTAARRQDASLIWRLEALYKFRDQKDLVKYGKG